jgi:hypothetical protein
MSRIEGFDVMDVSTSILHDPKFIRLGREYPALAGPGFTAYLSVTAESWKAGERLSIDDAWPVILAFNDAVVGALRAVKLLDARGRVTASAWRGFFEQARARREKSRERWRRANEARGQKPGDLNGNDSAATSRLPRGANAVTAPPSDSVRPSESESKKTPPNPPRRGGPRNRTKPAGLTDYDALMVSDEDELGSFAEAAR